jgi:hypothetical protein
VTIATSHGLVYSLGENLRQLYERRKSALAQVSHDGYSPQKYLSTSPRTPANKRKKLVILVLSWSLPFVLAFLFSG